MRLAGTVCLVTGASSGIGRATALRLARAGARLVVTGRDERRLRDVAERVGGTAVVADLGSDAGPGEVAAAALSACGRVDVLVNNAGVGWAGEFTATGPGEVVRLVTVNLAAPLELGRLLLPGMRERGDGHLVMVSSIAGCVGVGREAVYAATKAGLNAFAESLRYELAGSGVGVSVVVPGVIDTEFFARRGTPYARTRPRPVPAERVAAAILRAVERGRDEVFVPAWLRLPARVHGALPAVFRRLAARA